jgi:DNA-directed RNA polymerase specialized sigma24 family protein
MEVRRQRRKPVPVHLSISGSEDEQLPIDLPDWRPNPEQQYAQSELRDFITRLLQELRPRLPVVFIMHNIKGQRLEEAGGATAEFVDRKIAITASEALFSRAAYAVSEK